MLSFTIRTNTRAIGRDDFLAEFAKRRGYRLEDHLPLDGAGNRDEVARVKCDYRETVSDLVLENLIEPWTAWSHEHGMLAQSVARLARQLARYLCGVRHSRNRKLWPAWRQGLESAGVAVRILGRSCCGQAACIGQKWILPSTSISTRPSPKTKECVDRLFLAGVNHVIYHGTAYSPQDVAWPGWLFYAAIMALVAFLWVRSTNLAIRRADRAEEVAMLEFRELQRTGTLEEGVRYLQQTLSLWAQGNFTRRVPVMPLDILEQVRMDLNAFMEWFGPVMDASYYLRRLQTEVNHLTTALENRVNGRPVAWPELSGTPLDHVIDILRSYGTWPQSHPSSTSAPLRPSGPTGAPRFTPGPIIPPTSPRVTGTPPPYMPQPPYPMPPQPDQPFGADGAREPDGGAGDAGTHWP